MWSSILRTEANRTKDRHAQGDHYLNLGHAYRTAGKGGEAMAAFEHAVRLLPRNPGVYLTLGQ